MASGPAESVDSDNAEGQSGSETLEPEGSAPSGYNAQDPRHVLAMKLGVPAQHLAKGHRHSVREAWQKVKDIALAQKTLSEKIKANNWSGQRPSETDIRSLFCSSSTWDSHWKHFAQVQPSTPLWEWLEETEGQPSALELWGRETLKPSFTELKEVIKNKGYPKKGKGKGKGKKDKKGEGSGKGKGKKKSSSEGSDSDSTESTK
jgi:hypothetical protein